MTSSVFVIAPFYFLLESLPKPSPHCIISVEQKNTDLNHRL